MPKLQKKQKCIKTIAKITKKAKMKEEIIVCKIQKTKHKSTDSTEGRENTETT